MSLADLPDHMIAHLCSYLDYPDICNLMETSKKNYNAIKGYKVEKIKLDLLEIKNENKSYVCVAKQSEKSFTLKCGNSPRPCSEVFKDIMDQCSSINKLEFHTCAVSCKLFNMLKPYKIDIGSIGFYIGVIRLSYAELIEFCNIFKGMIFRDVFVKNVLLTDDLFINILPHTSIEFYRRENNANDATKITDCTLEALFGEEKMHNCFAIDDVHNSFTIKGIRNMLEKAEARKVKDIKMHLGILRADQRAEATKFRKEYTFPHPYFGKYIIKKWHDYEEELIHYHVTAYVYDEVLHKFANISFDIAML